MASITFQPIGMTVSVKPGTSILKAAQDNGLFMRSVCGANAICGTCRCTVIKGMEGLSPVARHERKRLQELYAGPDVRLSCQAEVLGDVEVRIPVPTLGLA